VPVPVASVRLFVFSSFSSHCPLLSSVPPPALASVKLVLANDAHQIEHCLFGPPLRSLSCRSSWSIKKNTASLHQPPITAILARPSLKPSVHSPAFSRWRASLYRIVQLARIACDPNVAAGHAGYSSQSKPAGPNQSPSLWLTPAKSAALLASHRCKSPVDIVF